MNRKIFRQMRIAMVVVACLANAMPAWAGASSKVETHVYLQGVNRHGCLTDCGGSCETFCAVINCRTGKFVGKAKGCVENNSCENQCYLNVDFFKDCRFSVACSKYKVSKYGDACYTAKGCFEEKDEYENGDEA